MYFEKENELFDNLKYEWEAIPQEVIHHSQQDVQSAIEIMESHYLLCGYKSILGMTNIKPNWLKIQFNTQKGLYINMLKENNSFFHERVVTLNQEVNFKVELPIDEAAIW